MHNVYTDGSCLGNPGAGGWAVLIGDVQISSGQDNTTNNIMEMTAVVKALEECIKQNILEIQLFTDSTYVKNGISSWIHGWKRNGWKTSAGTPVKNKDLWVQMDALSQKMTSVEWKWVKAHNGHPQNELVDTLAFQEATRIKNMRVK
jgi:ribonuclease HI